MALTKDYRFSSERLEFRGIAREDAEAIVGWRSDPANYENFLDARPITLESHLAWFGRYLNDPDRYDFVILEGGRPIGTCGLSGITPESCEASYMVGDVSCRGKGYATEALKAITDVAFRELGVEHVDLRILPHNMASMKVAVGGGFSEHERIFTRRAPDTAADEQ